jgi:hypothetical protein
MKPWTGRGRWWIKASPGERVADLGARVHSFDIQGGKFRRNRSVGHVHRPNRAKIRVPITGYGSAFGKVYLARRTTI